MNSSKAEPQQAEAVLNSAIWLTAKGGGFDLQSAPYTRPRDNEIVVKNGAVAINPYDWIAQYLGDIGLPWMKYPFILGSDVAGQVVEVGSAVSRFKVGDRVLGHAVGLDKDRNTSAEGAFQNYTVLLERLTAPIPESMSYESAAVLPLGISTAASGMFQKNQLALQHPSAQPEPTGKMFLIWGGSTSVGSNAIQLAAAAGYEVVTTASPQNFEFARRLGAKYVFDYRSETVVHDIIKACKGRHVAGALAIGVGSTDACLDILGACKGTKFIAIASPPVSFESVPQPRTVSWLVPILARMVALNVTLVIKALLRGIKLNFIWGSSLKENEVSKLIYADFLPKALADGAYVAAPQALVVGHGLECIPAAVEAQKKGVSARKVVVTL